VSTLKTYAREEIGAKRVDTIATEDILKILSPIWTNKTETAKRIQGRIENILDYAAAHKFRDPLNPARWRGHLDKLLPKPSRVKKVKHLPAMPYTEVPIFMMELSQNGSVSALALQFLILTATRTSEILEAPWSEIDLKAKVKADGREFEWKAFHTTDQQGIVNLDRHLADMDHVGAFAYAEITVDEAQDVVLKIGSDDSIVIRINGEKVHAFKGARGVKVDQDTAKAHLEKGTNKVLVKILDNVHDWGFCIRVTTPAGDPVSFKQRKE